MWCQYVGTSCLKQGYYLANSMVFFLENQTCTQLLESVHDWALSLRGGNPVDVIYIDFTRAFDSIVHSKLMAKLKVMNGIGYELHGWTEEFLTGR